MCFAQCSWTYIVSLEAEFQIQREALSCLTQTGEGFLFEFGLQCHPHPLHVVSRNDNSMILNRAGQHRWLQDCSSWDQDGMSKCALFFVQAWVEARTKKSADP